MPANTGYINLDAWCTFHMWCMRMYLWWSLCTLYLHACQVRVTVGDSGLCCCTCVTYFEGELTPSCVCCCCCFTLFCCIQKDVSTCWTKWRDLFPCQISESSLHPTEFHDLHPRSTRQRRLLTLSTTTAEVSYGEVGMYFWRKTEQDETREDEQNSP